MFKIVFLFVIMLLLTPEIFPQPSLKIDPNKVRFRDIFTRLDSTSFINDGDQILRIDSLVFQKNDFYNIYFEENRQVPFTITPDDTVTTYVILENFYNITVSDTIDTILVYHNGTESPRKLRIEIDFFDDDMAKIICNVRDSFQQPLGNTDLYYFYYGIYLVGSARTDPNGYYELNLPKGIYTVAAAKPGYRTIFNNDTPDPFFAPLVQLDSGQTVVIDYTMPSLSSTNYSVSGVVYDSASGGILNKGVVIVRKGSHAPSRMMMEDSTVYAGFIAGDGSYSVNVESDTFYYVQTYSNYYLPGYYNSAGYASVFWQNADTLLINSNISDKNIYLQRDLSFGGGMATGNINIPNYESLTYEGITLFARSVSSGQLYNYGFGKDDATFRLDNIPYGNYELIAQRVGLPNAISQQFTIDSLNPFVSDLSIIFEPSSVSEDNNFIVEDFHLLQNYPNPFNPSTRIQWQSYVNSKTTLKVYDVLGNEVATLVDAELPAGKYEVDFSAKESLSSGVYIYRLQAGDYSSSKKMILLR